MSQRAQDPTAPATPGVETPPPAEDAPESPADAFRDVGPRLAELAEYVNYYVAAQIDRIKSSVRKAGFYAVIGVIGLLALVTFIITAVVLLCVGVAGMMSAAFGGRAWAGNLVTAILFLGLLAGGIWVGYRRLTHASRERTIRKYAQRQQQQRAHFGADVTQRSRKPTE